MWIKFYPLPPKPYLTLMGEFIARMSHAEFYLKQLLWQATGVSEENGILLFGDGRVTDVTNLLRKWYCRHCENQLVYDDLASIIDKFDDLSKYRSDMAHGQWSTKFPPGSVVLNTEESVLKQAKVVVEKIKLAKQPSYSLHELEELCVDAHILNGRLFRFLMMRTGVNGVRAIEQMWDASLRWDGGDTSLPPAPWLDKSSPRVKRGDKTRRSSRKQPRQRRSSPR
jgi:hypothetical protein